MRLLIQSKYQYDAASRRTQMTVAGQTAVNYSYDNADRLTGITQGSNSVGIAYDNANRRTTLTLPNGIQLTYGFDNANELTGLTYKLGATTVGSLTYGYDNDGRIVNRGGTFDVTNLPATLASASYDANNRLTQWGAKTLSYDADGNLTGDGTNTYTWNTRNQLMSIAGGSTGSFIYDAFGRRESKTIGGTATNFLYDGLNLEQELNGTTPTANYLTGANIDEVFSRADSTGSYSYLTDNLGSSLALTNSSGAISTSYTYEPYGNTTASGASSTNALQYTGRENDGDGLYYYRARYYSPGYRRFIGNDPIGYVAGISTYTYVNNDPMDLVDSLGLCPNKKNDCVHNFLQQYYGNFVANTLVPDFSGISFVTNFWEFAKGSLVDGGIKGALVGLPWLYGNIVTTTGNNLAAYPGMSGAAADALETGAFWKTTAGTFGSISSVAIIGITSFATMADAYARWACRNVQ